MTIYSPFYLPLDAIAKSHSQSRSVSARPRSRRHKLGVLKLLLVGRADRHTDRHGLRRVARADAHAVGAKHAWRPCAAAAAFAFAVLGERSCEAAAATAAAFAFSTNAFSAALLCAAASSAFC